MHSTALDWTDLGRGQDDKLQEIVVDVTLLLLSGQ